MRRSALREDKRVWREMDRQQRAGASLEWNFRHMHSGMVKPLRGYRLLEGWTPEMFAADDETKRAPIRGLAPLGQQPPGEPPPDDFLIALLEAAKHLDRPEHPA